ncbi:hypothetical protein EHW61_16755, partial [Salinivibrio sp. VYel6]|uniref:hypothetical protein n=1 Tax=Salinivibrio sp. VYel6 TaxID=2490493 RepID=UPI00128B2B1C
MKTAEAVNAIHEEIKRTYGVNTAFTRADEAAFSEAVTGYKKGALSLDEAAHKAYKALNEEDLATGRAAMAKRDLLGVDEDKVRAGQMTALEALHR